MFSKLLASGGITIAMLADASPIAMREWLVAEMYVIANSDLPLFYDTACKLVRSTWALIAGLDCDIDRKECDQILAKCVFHHMLPPMAMGSRATDIVHKLITILSMLSRDIGPWPTIQLIVDSVISWTTDFGTEALFAPLWNMLKHLQLSHLQEIFPGGTHFAYSDDDNLDEVGGVGPLSVLENVCKSKMVFEIAGGLHQTNNTSKDLDEHCLGSPIGASMQIHSAAFFARGGRRNYLLPSAFAMTQQIIGLARCEHFLHHWWNGALGQRSM